MSCSKCPSECPSVRQDNILSMRFKTYIISIENTIKISSIYFFVYSTESLSCSKCPSECPSVDKTKYFINAL